ncbi:MAG TPA: protein phosphatase 2C domain-containing protein, partial [Chloroflexia bacterium]|nr:protein phosphatase 2C domain-containing protein [Chloroflexia bacterium]
MQSNNDNEIDAFRWVGSESMLLDVPSVISCGRVLVGRYGGRLAAGANKNEDGALVWSAADGTWEFALIIDAHYSAESAELLLQMVQDERHNLLEHLRRPDDEVFALVHEHLVSVLMSPEFRARCREVEGEASCIFCVRKGSFLWWMSVGDCVVYLLHPELARLGQFALNQRSYYEWVGRRNTFDLEVPCYTSGVKELQP